MKLSYTCCLLLLLFLVSGLIIAGTINVPADYSTIQLAINASVDGDTVLVAPGVYYENINFRGKRIVLTSWYALDGNTMYIDSTIINGSQPIHADTASCVLIVSGEDASTVLQGFTLTGGTGTVWRDVHNGALYREGGGVLMEFSSAIVKNNIIKYNVAIDRTGIASAGGGGIRIGDGNPQIVDNIIMYNQGRYGAGIVLNFTGALIKNNVVYRNSGGEDFGGSGIWATNNGPAQKIIENNTVVENSSVIGGGGFYIASTSMSIRNTIIWGNTAPVDPQITIGSSLVNVSYCNVQGGWIGTGNINASPGFVDTSHYLSMASACIDAGNPNASYNDPEDSGNPGFAMHPSRGTVRNDIGAYGGPGTLPAPYIDLHLNDPQPPSNVYAYSDYQTPNSVLITWNDPTRTNSDDPLSNFKIHLYREGVFVAEIDSGVQTFTDNGLTLHQNYTYTINAVVPNDSSIFDSITVYAGGAAQPKPVSLFSTSDDSNGVWLQWKNPSSQIDNAPLNDIAFILIYRDGIILDSVPQSMSDTGQIRTYFDIVEGYHKYKIKVRDNESPINYSVESEEILGYGGLVRQYNEGFEFGVGSIYRTGSWDTTSQFAKTGSLSLTDSPGGISPASMTAIVLLPPVILGTEPVLSYEDIAIIRSSSFAFIEISANGRTSFSSLKAYNAYVQPGWADGVADTSDWIREVIDLKAYAGDTVVIRFRLVTSTAARWDGWYIDDIVIREAGEIVTDSFNVIKGWNMVSVPFRVEDKTVSEVFPTSVSKAYIYNKGYVRQDTLEAGNGYFVKFDSSETVTFTGVRNWKDTILVNAGWNIIGSPGLPLDTAEIFSLPSGIIQTAFYGFDESGYHPEQTLMPGRAYWVKVTNAGKLITITTH